jgi:hypothetical protein
MQLVAARSASVVVMTELTQRMLEASFFIDQNVMAHRSHSACTLHTPFVGTSHRRVCTLLTGACALFSPARVPSSPPARVPSSPLARVPCVWHRW